MPLVVILGMHRSGTSFLMHSLHAAGLYLGDQPPLMNGCDNLEGFWEAPEAVSINDRILVESGGAWDNVPSSLRIDDETAGRMPPFLDGLRDKPIAGWKDPRTTITFPLWKPHLGDYRIVAAVRHPMNVARSLQVRHGWRLEKGLQLWSAYNERLQQTTSDERDVLWFNFDQTPEDIRSNICRICERLHLDCAPAADDPFNRFLRHHSHAAETIDDPRVADLYQTLCERFQRFQSGRSNPGGSGVAPPPMTGDPSSLAAQIDQLARAQSLENACVQQLYSLLQAAQADTSHLQARLDGLQSLIEQTRAAHDEIRRRQDALDQERREVSFELARMRSDLERVQVVEIELRTLGQVIDRWRGSKPFRFASACLRALARCRRLWPGDSEQPDVPVQNETAGAGSE
jgi:hypothetical protein